MRPTHLASLALAACLIAPPALAQKPVAPSALAITGASVVDTADGSVARETTVLVVGDRIERVARDRSFALPPDTRIVDARGRFVIPGLWDMHVHGFLDPADPHWFFPMTIAYGVTGVRDMGSLVPLARQLATREEVRRGQRVGPRLRVGGPALFGFEGDGLALPTPEDGRKAVRTLAQRGADFVSINPLLPRDTYFALVDEARTIGIAVAGPVPESVSVHEAAFAGQRSFEHLDKLVLGCSGLEEEVVAERAAMLARRNGLEEQLDRLVAEAADEIDEMIARIDPTRCRRTIQALAVYGTWLVPAIVAEDAMRPSRHDPGDPRLAYLPTPLAELWREISASLREQTPQEEARAARLATRMVELIPALRRNGVKLLAGTNAGSITPFVFPGASLHDELARLVDAGLTPLEALQSATLDVGLYFDAGTRIGRVAAGYDADLLLVEANPLENIRDTRRIAAVVAGGRYFDRRALDALLAGSRAAADSAIVRDRAPR